MVSERLKNDRLKKELLGRVFPQGQKPGNHRFSMESDRCGQCGLKFWDWMTEKEDGLYAGSKLCPVIGLDEIAKFRDDDHLWD